MLLCKAGANCLMTNAEKKTAKELADMATQNETVEYLAKCETGLIPDEPPKRKVEMIMVVKDFMVVFCRREVQLSTRRLSFLLVGPLANTL